MFFKGWKKTWYGAMDLYIAEIKGQYRENDFYREVVESWIIKSTEFYIKFIEHVLEQKQFKRYHKKLKNLDVEEVYKVLKEFILINSIDVSIKKINKKEFDRKLNELLVFNNKDEEFLIEVKADLMTFYEQSTKKYNVKLVNLLGIENTEIYYLFYQVNDNEKDEFMILFTNLARRHGKNHYLY